MMLRDLTAEWLEVYEMLEDPEADLKAIADTLEGIEGEIEVKADNYAVIINELKADAEKIRAEEKRLADRRRALENRVEYLKATLEGAMLATGKLKFKTPFYSFGIQKNPPTVIIDDAEKIPPEYLLWVESTINKKQLLVDIRSGKDLAGVAHLVQTEGLRIR